MKFCVSYLLLSTVPLFTGCEEIAYQKCMSESEIVGIYVHTEGVTIKEVEIQEVDTITVKSNGQLERQVYENGKLMFEYKGSWKKYLNCYYDMNIDQYAWTAEARKDFFTGRKKLSFGSKSYYSK